jgi:hypothetical protein
MAGTLAAQEFIERALRTAMQRASRREPSAQLRRIASFCTFEPSFASILKTHISAGKSARCSSQLKRWFTGCTSYTSHNPEFVYAP